MFTQDGSKGENAQRSYNFSDARIDLLPQFAELSDRPDVCLPNRVASGLHAYNLVGENHLKRCAVLKGTRFMATPRWLAYARRATENVGVCLPLTSLGIWSSR